MRMGPRTETFGIRSINIFLRTTLLNNVTKEGY